MPAAVDVRFQSRRGIGIIVGAVAKPLDLGEDGSKLARIPMLAAYELAGELAQDEGMGALVALATRSQPSPVIAGVAGRSP